MYCGPFADISSDNVRIVGQRANIADNTHHGPRNTETDSSNAPELPIK
jgi:hypothetical protein